MFDPYAFDKTTIEDAIRDFYDRKLDADVEITVEHRSMNWFDATAVHTDARMGRVVTHYVVLVKDGNRIEFQ
jgi:hypothetical protein